MLKPLSLLLLLAAMPALAQPQQAFDCENSVPHRQFDFWLGEWAVHDAAGTLQGTNSIRKIQNGCALEEQWKSVRDGTGQSVNYYHPDEKQWHQLWHDAGASIIDITGGLDGDAMVLTGTIYYLNRQSTHPFRGRWTPLADGRVRQLFEQQDSEGEWQTWFDGYYSRSDTGARE